MATVIELSVQLAPDCQPSWCHQNARQCWLALWWRGKIIKVTLAIYIHMKKWWSLPVDRSLVWVFLLLFFYLYGSIIDVVMFGLIRFIQAHGYCLFSMPLLLHESHLICQSMWHWYRSSPVRDVRSMITLSESLHSSRCHHRTIWMETINYSCLLFSMRCQLIMVQYWCKTAQEHPSATHWGVSIGHLSCVSQSIRRDMTQDD